MRPVPGQSFARRAFAAGAYRIRALYLFPFEAVSGVVVLWDANLTLLSRSQCSSSCPVRTTGAKRRRT
jgi:hypothetical protein